MINSNKEFLAICTQISIIIERLKNIKITKKDVKILNKYPKRENN